MREIQLSKKGKNRGKYVAFVDDEDFEMVNQFNWCVRKGRNTYYAIRRLNIDGKIKNITLHEFIMGRIWIDHIDRNGLNCQRHNMRPCDNQQNSLNRGNQNNSLSKYKGVSWSKANKKWVALIRFKGRREFLGGFDSQELAAGAYDMRAGELYGEFAVLNFNN